MGYMLVYDEGKDRRHLINPLATSIRRHGSETNGCG